MIMLSINRLGQGHVCQVMCLTLLSLGFAVLPAPFFASRDTSEGSYVSCFYCGIRISSGDSHLEHKDRYQEGEQIVWATSRWPAQNAI